MTSPTAPAVPYFTASPKRHAIDFCREAETHIAVRTSNLLSREDAEWTAYDSAGTAWGLRYERPSSGVSALTRLLARTVYDPVRRVAVSWTDPRPYPLDELRRLYLDALDDDDDVLSQFHEHDEIERRVRACSAFQDFVDTWEWMSTEAEPPDAAASAPTG